MELAHAVVAFYEGARNHAVGAVLTNNKVIGAALEQIKTALDVIDRESQNGRDILLPFLSHREPMVRCEAVQALHPTRRDLATPVLLDLDLTCVTEAAETAYLFLVFAGEPNSGSDLLAGSHPPRYSDDLYQEALSRI